MGNGNLGSGRGGVLPVSEILTATNVAKRYVKAGDEPPSGGGGDEDVVEVDWIGLSRGVGVEDHRRPTQRSPVTGKPVWEGVYGIRVDHKALVAGLADREAYLAFPRYCVVVYDSVERTYRSFFSDDQAACDRFARGAGLAPGSKAEDEDKAPGDAHLAGIAAARGVELLIGDPRGVPLTKRQAMAMGDALMKNYHLTIGAMTAAYVGRTFGRGGQTPPTAVVLADLDRASPERVYAIRHVLRILRNQGRPARVWCPDDQVAATRRALGSATPEVLPLRVGQAVDPELARRLAVGEATSWREGAPDQEVWLRQTVMGCQARTASEGITLESAFLAALMTLQSVPTWAGERRQVVVWVGTDVAREAARRDADRLRTYRPNPTLHVLERLRDAVASLPTSECLDEFNRLRVSGIPARFRGLGWLADAAAEAEANGRRRVPAMVDVRAATALAASMTHGDVRKLTASVLTVSGARA